MRTDAASPPLLASYGRAMAVLVFGACAIGVAPILVRLADAGPAAVGFWRMAFALPLLALIALRPPRGPAGSRRPAPLSLLAGALFALNLIFWHYGIHYASVANATVLANLAPVFVTIAAWLILKEKPRALFVVALALALAGAWTIALNSPRGGGGLDPPLGELFSCATAFWSAGYFIAMRAARQVQSAYLALLWSTLVTAPLMLLAAVVLGERLWPASAGGWGACVGLGLMHVGGQGAIAWALGRLPAATTSLVVLLQPVVAAALGWMLFGEALSVLQIVGAAVALAGVVLAQRSAVSRPAV
jgi:drug/metabolite transporter (DMT)-like permease